MADAYTLALTLLSARELSETQLRARLARRQCDAQAIDDTVSRLKSDGTLNDKRVALALASVVFTEFPPAHAYKATIERRIASGAVGDTDVYGAQQHAPLLDVEIPI